MSNTFDARLVALMAENARLQAENDNLRAMVQRYADALGEAQRMVSEGAERLRAYMRREDDR